MSRVKEMAAEVVILVFTLLAFAAFSAGIAHRSAGVCEQDHDSSAHAQAKP